MAYFADLTPYSYLKRVMKENVVNVGWLDDQHAFPQGEVSDAILAKLFALWRDPVNLARGKHSCQFCHLHRFGHVSERDGVQIGVGSGKFV